MRGCAIRISAVQFRSHIAKNKRYYFIIIIIIIIIIRVLMILGIIMVV